MLAFEAVPSRRFTPLRPRDVTFSASLSVAINPQRCGGPIRLGRRPVLVDRLRGVRVTSADAVLTPIPGTSAALRARRHQLPPLDEPARAERVRRMRFRKQSRHCSTSRADGQDRDEQWLSQACRTSRSRFRGANDFRNRRLRTMQPNE